MNLDKQKIVFISLSAVLLIAAIIMGVLLMDSRKQNEEMQELFAIEKEELENEYSSFATQYDELQIRITNDSLQDKLEQEKLKTQQLLEELRQTKATDAAEIMRLKKELATVRAVLRSYVVQIDSLNRANEILQKENKRVKARYSEATRQIDKITEEKENLTKKVTLASQLDAIGISLTPLKKNGKAAKKLKDAKKFAIGFTIAKNITSETGEKTIYVRIMKPDEDILAKSASDTFPYEGKTLTYSIKKYIEYTGEEQAVTVYWDIEEFLQAGTYKVFIFADGNMIGSQSFSIKK
jgi:predicted RNase H-like nuclease (RuvC/YqgF family)